jgi:hypothetical protein
LKKFLPAAVLTAFLLFLAACGSKPSGTAPASSGPAASLVKDNKIVGQAAKDPCRDSPVSGAGGPDAAALLTTTRLPDLFGAVKPLAAHKGTAGILLAFVDTKCPFSNVAIRELPKVAFVLQPKGITSLLVNIGEPEAAVKSTYAPNVPVVYDTGKTTQERWNVHSVPTVVLLDSAGSVAYEGTAAWTGVAAATEKMLNLTAGSVLLDEAQSTIQG